MLEYNFDDLLDDDFITIWSKFLLTNDKKLIANEMEALAELGQINAVQSWYLIKQSKENANIDKIVKSYTGANFNEYWAMANAVDKKQISNDFDSAYKHAGNEYTFGFAGEFIGYLNVYSDCFRYMFNAINMARDLHTNMYANQRVAEMIFSYQNLLPLDKSYKAMRKHIKLSKKFAKYALKQMEYVLEQQGDVYQFLRTNPQFSFALAKNHYFFSKKEKEKQFAADLFKDLSNRELSAALQEQIKLLKYRETSANQEVKKEHAIHVYNVSNCFEAAKPDELGL